jgi:hypothetical protein
MRIKISDKYFCSMNFYKYFVHKYMLLLETKLDFHHYMVFQRYRGPKAKYPCAYMYGRIVVEIHGNV